MCVFYGKYPKGSETGCRRRQKNPIWLCLHGIESIAEGEMNVDIDGFYKGDRTDQVARVQTDLMEIVKQGKPTILVCSTAVRWQWWENENIPAILEAWYPGWAGGTAIADVIFGDYNPQGDCP